MTDYDYKATPDQWAYQEHWAQDDPDAACLLELRDRVQSLEDDSWKQAESTSYCVDALVKRIEALEANTKQWRTDYLRLANTCAGMAEDRLEFFGKLLSDGESDPKGEILDYYSRLAAQHPGKATFHQDSLRSGSISPIEAGFNGEKGIRLNLPNMPDGGFYRLRRGSTDPRQLEGDFKRQFVWVSPEGDESELWWCNEDNEWFLVSFQRMAPL